MAKLWYSHFDSTAEDRRKLLAEDWARFIRSFISDGIRNGGSCLQVSAGAGGMFTNIACGTAAVQGYVVEITDDGSGAYSLIHKPSDNTNPRIDRVVLRLSREIQERNIKPVILAGTAKANPVPPPLTRNENIWELSLAQVRIEKGAADLSGALITDERFDSELCGLMHSVLGLDSSSWQAQFDRFMAAIEAQDDEFLKGQLKKFNSQLEGQQSDWQEQLNNQQEYFDSRADDWNLAAPAHTNTFDVALAANWTGEEAPFKQTVSIPGFKEIWRNAHIFLKPGGASPEAELEEYGKLIGGEGADGAVTFYASEKTEAPINIEIRAVF